MFKMRKFLSLFMMCVLASAAWAYDVVFDATVDLGTYPGTAGPFSIEKDCVTIDVANGVANGIHYRFYKGKDVIISSECGPITRVVFECIAEGDSQYGPGCFTVNVGNYSYEGKIGDWTGESDVIVFTASLNQVRVTKIIVTVGEYGLSAPVIKPAAGVYYTPIEVSITCYTSGAQIYYTTNGSEPTTSSTLYTAPFTLDANTTVKAISALDDEVSCVVTAEYLFETPTPVQNIWESNLLDDGTLVRFANPVQVLAQHNNHLFVKDDTGYALFYGNCGQSYASGDIIPAGFGGTMATYNCEREMCYLFGFQPASGNSLVQPELITAAQVGNETFGHLVELRGVVFNYDGNKYWIEDADGNQAAVYFNTMGATPPSNLDAVYNLIAIVGSYGNPNSGCFYQLLPIKNSYIGPPETVCDMMNSVENGTIIVSEFETQVILQSGSYLYFKQGNTCYGLIYGNVGQTYQKGDIIPPGWSAKKTTYSGEPELAAPFEGFQPPISNEPVIPEEVSPLQVDHEHWAHYVVMRNVTVTKANGGIGYIIITDSQGNSCTGYLRFLDDIQEGHYNAIWGIVGSYRTEYELLVTDFSPKPPIVPVEVDCISELLTYDSGVVGQFTSPLAVIYQNGNMLYVRDKCEDYGLICGELEGTFSPGDSIIGKASWQTYQGAVQLAPIDDWTMVRHGRIVNPEVMSIEDVSQAMVHWYVEFRGVDLNDFESGYQPNISDETGEMLLYNKFNVPIIQYMPGRPYDPNEDGEVNIADLNYIIDLILNPIEDLLYGKYDITGFIAVHQNQLEIYPVKIVYHGNKCLSCVWGDVNQDGETNIADVNYVINIILSE